MEIPRTHTSTGASSVETIQKAESNNDETKSISKQSGDSSAQETEKQSKASQGLAEQNKVAQNLQAEIHKNHLQQLLPAGKPPVICMPGFPDGDPLLQQLPPATTTTKTSSTSTTGGLDELAHRYGVDAKQIGDLKEYAKSHGVPEKDLVKVASNTRYSNPSEKAEAMKAYAVAYDAAHNSKLSPERAKDLKEHVLPNFLDGKIGVRLKDMGSARAQYNGLNEGNKDGYEPNTMYFPKEGIDLRKLKDRSAVVHESYHAAQDATKKPLTFMQAEKEGHSVESDYLLRESGAIKDTKEGPQVNFDKFNEVLGSFKADEILEMKCLADEFATTVDKNEKEGKSRLNEKLADGGPDSGKLIRSMVHNGDKSFDEVYILTKQRTLNGAGKSDEEIRRQLNTPAPKDGIN